MAAAMSSVIKPSAFVAAEGLLVRVRPRREEGEQCDGDEVAEGGLRPVHVGGAVEPGGVGKKDDAGGSEGRVEMASKEASGASAAAAWGQVVGDFGEVDELAREGAEAVDVGEVRRESERGADGAAGGKPDRLDVVVDRHCLAELAADERFARDRERNFAGAGVAEAAGAQRDIVAFAQRGRRTVRQ